MARARADLDINIRANTGSLNRAGNQIGAFGKKLGGVAKVAGVAALAGAGVAIVKLGKDSVGAASKLQQSSGAVETVFKTEAKTIKRWADQAAESVGLSKNEYQEMAAVVGSQLKGMGIPLGQSTKLTGELTKRAADLAATFGGTTQEAIGAVSSLLRGERDPIERYGVSLKQVDINAQLASKGQDKLTGTARKQAEAMAGVDLLMKSTADSSGAFARESDTLAGAQQRAQAKMENFRAEIGAKLLPIVTRMTQWFAERVIPALRDTAKWIDQNVVPALKVMGQWINDNVVPALQALGKWFVSSVIPAARALWDTLAAKLIPIFKDLWNTIQTQILPTLKILWGWFQKYLVPVLKVLAAVFIANLIRQFRIAVTVFKIAATAIATIVRWTQNASKWFADMGRAIGRISARALNVARDAIKSVYTWASTAYRWVRDLVSRIGAVSSGGFRSAWGAIKSVYDWARKALGWVRDLVGAVGSRGSGFLSGAISGITTLIGWIKNAIGWVSNLLGKLGGKALSIIKKVVPGLRYGGMSTGGTYWVGENGPELVTLPNRTRVTNAQRSQQVMAAGAGSAQSVTLNLRMDLGSDTITRTVQFEIGRSDRQLVRNLRARAV